MDYLVPVSENMYNLFPIVRTVLTFVILILVFTLIMRAIKRNLLRKAKTKKQISNVHLFTRLFYYTFLLIVILFAIFSYSGSWSSIGITVGLLSAAAGWALQRPITGLAAWIMVVTKRPFEIGDRVLIGGVKGDVQDITLTHIYIKEIDGLVSSEELSGRTVLVPNYILFEQSITNYTDKDEYVLFEVVVSITYESNLDKAMKIGLDAANKVSKDFIKEVRVKPYIRTAFADSAINMHVKYYAPARRLIETSSDITQEIFRNINKTNDVEIAYPHLELMYRKKNK